MKERLTQAIDNLLDQLSTKKVSTAADLKELAIATLISGLVVRSAETWREIDQAGGFSAWFDERIKNQTLQ